MKIYFAGNSFIPDTEEVLFRLGAERLFSYFYVESYDIISQMFNYWVERLRAKNVT